jgi:hypothetical protein
MFHPTDLTALDFSLIELQNEVRSHFGWKLSADVESAESLLRAVEESPVEAWTRHRRAATIADLRRRLVLREVNVAVLGAAVEVSEVIAILDKPTLLVGADGAVGVLQDLPETIADRAWSRLVCVVSDGDGGPGTLAAVKRGVPFILHSHGDNEKSWRSLLKLAENTATPSPLVLTHQTPNQIDGMHNPGGFTDGDRAVCFLIALGLDAERIKMLGTRSDIVGKWSGATDPERKLVKLQWMDRVIRMLGVDY